MLSIVIPCYNEEKNIHNLVVCFDDVFKAIDEPVELILVNNGSQDGTKEQIEIEQNNYSFIKLVDVEENQGYGFGILCGLKAASGDYIGWMHADLQSDPKVFLDMIKDAKVLKINFLLKGRRRNRPISDTLFTICMSVFESLYLGTLLWDINSQPTLLSREFYECWEQPPYDFSLDLYVYASAKKGNLIIKKYDSPQKSRQFGTSSWNTGLKSRFKLIKRVLNYSKELKKRWRI